MGTEYIRQEDAHMRLDNSICMYKDRPVLVRVFMDDPVNVVKALRLGTTKTITIQVSDKDFSTKAVKLGFVNHEKRAHYCYRSPDRRQKEGTPTGAIMVHDRTTRISTISHTSAFEDMILGKYPELPQVINQLLNDGSYHSIAFNRDFACSRDTSISHDALALHFRDRVIGHYDPESKSFRLYPGLKDASFLAPHLKKLNVPIQ